MWRRPADGAIVWVHPSIAGPDDMSHPDQDVDSGDEEWHPFVDETTGQWAWAHPRTSEVRTTAPQPRQDPNSRAVARRSPTPSPLTLPTAAPARPHRLAAPRDRRDRESRERREARRARSARPGGRRPPTAGAHRYKPGGGTRRAPPTHFPHRPDRAASAGGGNAHEDERGDAPLTPRRSSPPAPRTMPQKQYFAVVHPCAGPSAAVYQGTWWDIRPYVLHSSGAQHRGFPTEAEARCWLGAHEPELPFRHLPDSWRTRLDEIPLFTTADREAGLWPVLPPANALAAALPAGGHAGAPGLIGAPPPAAAGAPAPHPPAPPAGVAPPAAAPPPVMDPITAGVRGAVAAQMIAGDTIADKE
eukprot:gene2064-33415_t